MTRSTVPARSPRGASTLKVRCPAVCRLPSAPPIALLLLLTFAARTAAGQGGEPPASPVLRVEAGAHTAAVTGVSADTANRFLVTASTDKTARVWELETGQLLRVLRPPIGAGDDGVLLAVAISPDGRTVATGGWTRRRAHTIYFFDRESGRLLRRSKGFRNVITHLVYSRDGKYLAASVADGTVLIQTADGLSAREFTDYGTDSSDGADFDAAGRLVASSTAGVVGLFAADGQGRGELNSVGEWVVRGGGQPASVMFSPDGSRVAVGFRRPRKEPSYFQLRRCARCEPGPAFTAKVVVLDGRTLAPLYEPDTTGVGDGILSEVAWSADGRTLYAGGTHGDERVNRAVIRAWTDGGRGAYRDFATDATDAITDIYPLRKGGIVYSAADRTLGVLDAGGPQRLLTARVNADYGDNPQGLSLSAAGTEVGFGYELGGKSPARFSIAERRLDAADAASADLRLPLVESAGLRVTDWKNTTEPKLNGRRLAFGDGRDEAPREMSTSLAIAPDASAFLLGMAGSVRLFDFRGAPRWSFDTPAAALAVNISADGKLAVAAYGDGTIRWYRMADGLELLALFPHADRRRWVMWTPSGYYDASPGGEDLIGWHVNNGSDAAADLFPVGQFRAAYYRPDVVSRVLAAGAEQLALNQADEEAGRKQQQPAGVAELLPPVVEIVSPADGAEIAAAELTVRYRVRSPSGEPVTGVRLLIDGRPADGGRGLKLQAAATEGGAREAQVTLPPGESRVSVIASNRFATSVPATVRVRAAAAAPAPPRRPPRRHDVAAAAAFEIKPKLYILSVGVSEYADPNLRLGFAAKDASDFAAAMKRQRGFLYRDVVERVLTDREATKDNILGGLEWIRGQTTSKDVAMVLLAGHGVNDQNGRYYYLPYNTDVEALLRTAVSFEDIRATVSALAGKTLFFIDTCHSGNVLGGRRGLSLDAVGVINELASAENGAVVFAASTGNQYSLENPSWKNGAFTLALVEGVGGRADYTGQGRITVNMLDLYISERVKELTKGRQTPTTAKPQTVPDFPVAVRN